MIIERVYSRPLLNMLNYMRPEGHFNDHKHFFDPLI